MTAAAAAVILASHLPTGNDCSMTSWHETLLIEWKWSRLRESTIHQLMLSAITPSTCIQLVQRSLVIWRKEIKRRLAAAVATVCVYRSVVAFIRSVRHCNTPSLSCTTVWSSLRSAAAATAPCDFTSALPNCPSFRSGQYPNYPVSVSRSSAVLPGRLVPNRWFNAGHKSHRVDCPSLHVWPLGHVMPRRAAAFSTLTTIPDVGYRSVVRLALGSERWRTATAKCLSQEVDFWFLSRLSVIILPLSLSDPDGTRPNAIYKCAAARRQYVVIVGARGTVKSSSALVRTWGRRELMWDVGMLMPTQYWYRSICGSRLVHTHLANESHHASEWVRQQLLQPTATSFVSLTHSLHCFLHSNWSLEAVSFSAWIYLSRDSLMLIAAVVHCGNSPKIMSYVSLLLARPPASQSIARRTDQWRHHRQSINQS